MSAAIVENTGTVRQLDARAGEQINVTSADVKDAEKLARLLQQALRENAELRRRWAPRELYFRDQALPASGSVRLTHNFRGLVNWAVVRWSPTAAGAMPVLAQTNGTDADALVLTSGAAGTATIRVWEAG